MVKIRIVDYGDSSKNRVVFMLNGNDMSYSANFSIVNIMYKLLEPYTIDIKSYSDRDETVYELTQHSALEFMLMFEIAKRYGNE